MGLDSEADFAWAAGFLDGEGCFLCRPVEKGGQKTPGVLRRKPSIDACQCAEEPIRKLQRILGGMVITLNRKTVTGKTVWHWQNNSARQIRAILPKLLPYLTVKRDAAELLLAHAITFSGARKNGWLTTAVIERRAVIEAAMASLP